MELFHCTAALQVDQSLETMHLSCASQINCSTFVPQHISFLLLFFSSMCMCVYVYVCMCVYVYVYVCVYLVQLGTFLI